jgi:malate synthase
VAKEVFDAHLQGENQLHVLRDDVQVTHATEEELVRPARGTRTEAGMRHNIRVGVMYLEAWLGGLGCVPLYNLMEDAATAEISRAQVWQWIRHGATLEGGQKVTLDLFLRLLEEELVQVRREVGDARFDQGNFAEAKLIFAALSTSKTFEEFLTLPAYERLLALSPSPNLKNLTQEQR